MPKPLVASYCTTFLKPEMLHIYRQVIALQRYATAVITKERQNPERYPFERVIVLEKPRSNFVRRFYLKYVKKAPAIFYRGEFQVLSKALDVCGADLMHIYFGHTGVHLLPFIEVWEKPCVVSFHGADVMVRDDKPDYALRMHTMLQKAALVLVRSRSLWRRVEALGCPDTKLRLNRTGIPLDQFPMEERIAPADGEWHCVQACRLIAKKGLFTAIKAFGQFRRHYPKAVFTIAGDGPLLAEIEEKVRSANLGRSVRLVGFLEQDQLRALFKQAHIFLHPSEITRDENQEGVPNSMLEAMATGLPVVATLHGGIPEAVRDQADGFLVRERNPGAVCDALCRMVAFPHEWMRMGHSASARVREEFEQRKQIARLEDCYDEARGGGG
jgi:colanic acid/amylovoran biosynthesis glycosyltransferase